MTLKTRIFVGTSGWTYKDWAKAFYPEGTKPADRIVYYGTQFPTVEINATFYRMPSQTMIEAWNERLPNHFHLVAKGSQVITHRKKLLNCEDFLELFLDRIRQLNRLKVVLWQLPPVMRKDLCRLDLFLHSLPKIRLPGGTVRYAVEFRHPSWWDEETADLLRCHKAAFVAVSHPTLPDTVYSTSDFLYLRFHGVGDELYKHDYSTDELAQWADRLAPLMKNRRLYAFFNNDYSAHAPQNAKVFSEILADKVGDYVGQFANLP